MKAEIFRLRLFSHHYYYFFSLEELIQTLIDGINIFDVRDLTESCSIKLQTLLCVIGRKFVQKEIFHDGDSNVGAMYKNHKALANLDSRQYLNDRNQLLLSFLNGCVNFDYQVQDNPTTLYAVAVAVEMIYYLRNLNLVLPHLFLVNLIQSFVSGSKTVSTLNGKISPSCGYTTYKTWLNDQGSAELECPKGDVITYFDNIGKYITRSYRVLSEKVPTADIITVTLNIPLNSENSLQKDLAIKEALVDEKIDFQEEMKETIGKTKINFRNYRNNYITNMLNLAIQENEDVEKKIQLMQKTRRCTNVECGAVYTNLKRKCDKCSSKVSYDDKRAPRFTS